VIVIALTTQYVALGTRTMNGAIVQINRQLEEAGEAAGATWLQTMRRITLPLVFPAFINGFLLVFLVSIKNLTQALVLFSPGSAVVSTTIYDRWSFGDTSVAAAMGVMITLLCVVLAVFLRRSSAASAGVA
jgi:iron(III) transport system permease protein